MQECDGSQDRAEEASDERLKRSAVSVQPSATSIASRLSLKARNVSPLTFHISRAERSATSTVSQEERAYGPDNQNSLCSCYQQAYDISSHFWQIQPRKPSTGPELILRGGPGNSDSVLRGRLALPTPPKGGEPEERGDEEHETPSRCSIYGSGGLGRVQGRQDAGGVGDTIWRASPPRSRNGSRTCWRGRSRCVAARSPRPTRRISRSSTPRSGNWRWSMIVEKGRSSRRDG